MNYDYFYNQEPEQYIHYQMPKIMFQDERLNSLSLNAKFLYCLLLDRAKSSFQKGFTDENGKVYVHFAHSELMKLIGCGRTKIYEYFNELDSEKGGIGLVERKQKVGIGKSDIIYVKNFAKSFSNAITSDTCSDLPYTYFCDDISSVRFKHYQIPKMLFCDERLQSVSNTAKMTYSFMLDRIQLSLSKGWKDEQGRIYIIFPQKELQQLLGCSIRAVNSALKELDINDGIGLIDRTRQGMNNPDIIYLLDFATSLKYKKPTSKNDSVNIGGADSELREVQNLNIIYIIILILIILMLLILMSVYLKISLKKQIFRNQTDGLTDKIITEKLIFRHYQKFCVKAKPNRQKDGLQGQA